MLGRYFLFCFPFLAWYSSFKKKKFEAWQKPISRENLRDWFRRANKIINLVSRYKVHGISHFVIFYLPLKLKAKQKPREDVAKHYESFFVCLRSHQKHIERFVSFRKRFLGLWARLRTRLIISFITGHDMCSKVTKNPSKPQKCSIIFYCPNKI